ncbi:2-hydroxyacid dehydrogenase [Desulfolucanica intricata]|uniref:2-hydroxyacid dehydrogenase n=1 Tax=Desulfolucanica intricata TaxID=1285191 RepID=UPI00082B6390|nr:2-hydroxyacid dehydrogenase [Desulfolucanica intricata]
MSYKVTVISARGEDTFLPEQVNKIKAVSDAVFYARMDPLTRDELVQLTVDADIVAITRRSVKHLGPDTLSLLPKLKGLAVYSTGCEWVDHYYLAQKGILLSYIKDYSTTSVAEHTMGLMLAMSRRIHLSSDKVRGLVPEYVSLCGWQLEGKKLGIIGMGNIGQRVAKLASAFGMEIYYYDLKFKEAANAAYLPLDELLQSCDMISLSASRQYQEPPILTADKIRLIKPGACLINAGRPELADTGAIVAAINEGRLVGYAVDEVLDKSLLEGIKDYGRILQTGHSAWYSREAIDKGTAGWAENIYHLAIDKPINIFKTGE